MWEREAEVDKMGEEMYEEGREMWLREEEVDKPGMV